MDEIYGMIKAHLATAVPFASHAGVEVTAIGDGVAEARLEQTGTSVNHIGSQHAGALFTLGEAASGGAMSGALAAIILECTPVAANATIAYKKIAKGTITAHARVSEPGAALIERIKEDGKAAFDVVVDMTNEAGEEVATMTVAWSVRKN